jgi:hypothetical protein
MTAKTEKDFAKKKTANIEAGDKTILIIVKPGVNFARNVVDIVREALLSADKNTVAGYIENLSDRIFSDAFTLENRKILAMLLRGEIKKKRGVKQEKGFADFIIWTHYKMLRNQGFRRQEAIRRTSEDLEGAQSLPKTDLFRQAAEGRYWKEENISENVEKIITKLDKIFDLTPETSK